MEEGEQADEKGSRGWCNHKVNMRRGMADFGTTVVETVG